MQKTYNVLLFCFSWKKKKQHIFTKREVLSGLNAHAEEDLAEAILKLQISDSVNEWEP